MSRFARSAIRLSVRAAAGLLVLYVGFVLSLSYPGWAFRYEAGTERLRVHSAEPLPPETTAWAETIMARLDAGPLPPDAGPYHLWITGDGWRRDWFFAGTPGAGGLVYALLPGRNAFLADGDIATDRLWREGAEVPPPRTLSAYAGHEITHLVQIERLGRWGYMRLDPVIREGLADYVVHGPAAPALANAVADWRRTAEPGEPAWDLMDRFGSYPAERLAVTGLLEETTADALLANGR